MSNRLRELGYSSDDGRTIICHREAGRGYENRYLHERCGVIRIDLERDSKSGRELVERLIAVVDQPRTLIGRSRNGSALLLFRVSENSDLPHTADDGIYKLLTRDGTRVTITYGSVDQTVDIDAWSWIKGRSPLDVERDSLAVLFTDIAQRAVDECFKVASWAPTAADLERERETAERIAKIQQEIAAGLHTPEMRQAAEDEAIVAANPVVGYADMLFSAVQTARARIQERLKA